MKNQTKSLIKIVKCNACGHHFDENQLEDCPTCHGTGRKKELKVDYFTSLPR